MAAYSLTQRIDQTQQTPGSAVLTALAGRLRSHAVAIKNDAARRTIGKDLKAAADVIEHLLMSLQDDAAGSSMLHAAAMASILGRDGFEAFLAGGARV